MHSRFIILFCLISTLISIRLKAQKREKRDSLRSLTLKEVLIKGKVAKALSVDKKLSGKELSLTSAGTLGETLSHIPGIQNAGFGPHAGAPMIRSLSGNRVKVLSNGLALNDLAGITPNVNLITDLDNTTRIDVFKSGSSILYGGKAIGGAINLKDNTIPEERVNKKITGMATAEGGINVGFKQAFDLNGDLGKGLVWHLGAMNRNIDQIRIPGNTKAPIAYDSRIDHLTQTMAQVNVQTETTRNLSLYPYISQFVLDNLHKPEWGLSEADLYTFQENSTIGGVVVPNPKNSLYVPGQPPGTPLSTTIVKGISDYAPVTRGLMPNSHADSYALHLGTSYVAEKFYTGIGYKRTYGYYGIPGFALRRLPGHSHAGHVHTADEETTYLPINTRSSSNSLSMASAYRPQQIGIEELRLNYMMQGGQDTELIGDFQANQFNTQRQTTRLEIEQQPISFLKGMSGVDFSFLKLKGNGEQRYLPDNLSRELGVFTLQKFATKWLEAELGYRRDWLARRAMPTPDYKTSRGLGGGKLSPRNFKLDHYHAALQANLGKVAFLKASFVHAERAPEVNELYAGNNHFAIMLEENGDDRLQKEIAKTKEYTIGWNLTGFRFLVSYYQTQFDQYLYLAHTGISRTGGFLVKEWRQANTRITGWEAEMDYQHTLSQKRKIHLSAYADLVKNINISGDRMRDWAEGDYMPNMPTSRFGFSGGATFRKWEFNILFDRYLRQRFLGKNINPEPPMPAYSLLAARCSYQGQVYGKTVHYFLSGNNLLNVEARPQNSFLKYLAPLPGISFSVGVSMSI